MCPRSTWWLGYVLWYLPVRRWSMMVCVAGSMMMLPSSRPITKRHWAGRNTWHVRAGDVPDVATSSDNACSRWSRTPTGFGLALSQHFCTLLDEMGNNSWMDWLFSDLVWSAAHSGVSGICQTEIVPLASPRNKYFNHFPSRLKMTYLKAGGHFKLILVEGLSWANSIGRPK